MPVIVNKTVSKNRCSSRSHRAYSLDGKRQTMKQFIMIMTMKNKKQNVKRASGEDQGRGQWSRKDTQMFYLSCVW